MKEQGKIFTQIVAIMKDIAPVGKDRKNTQQNYQFRGVDDAMNMLSPLFAKHGVFPTTASITNIAEKEVVSKAGSAGWRVVNRYTFRFYAEDGSYIESSADGEAIDYGDKSSNKAFSTAYRECLWKTFVVPVQGSEDIENYNHEIKPKMELQPHVEPEVDVSDKPSKGFEAAKKKIIEATDKESLEALEAKITNSTKLDDEEKNILLTIIDERIQLIP